jgi:ammonium transporter, Amt family
MNIDTGTTAWMLTSTALVLLMVPGLAMFYGGLVRTKNVIGTMMHSFSAIAVVGVLWTVIGYALSFGTSRGGLIGWDRSFLFLSSPFTNMIDNGNGKYIPEIVFVMFQGKFAIITPALIAGAFAERVKFRSYLIFIACWALLVYFPLAHWIWGGGFLTGKAIDFAGGTVIHISAGVAGIVSAVFLGKRIGYPRNSMRPNNLAFTLIGAGLLWVGWFGFNAGSSLSSDALTGQALAVTQIAAASGALAWMLIEAITLKKTSSLGFVSGILAGLVAITPAAGAVAPWGALVLGIGSSAVCYFALHIKPKLGYDDTLDVFGIHGVAGIFGAVGLTFVMKAGATETGLIEQLKYQLGGVGISILYSAVVTLLLLFVINKLFGFRLSPSAEKIGMDHNQHGEHGYGFVNLD